MRTNLSTSPVRLILAVSAFILLASSAFGQDLKASAQLYVGPSSLNFGNVNVGSSLSLPAALKATGSTVTVTSAVSSNPAFTLSGVSVPFTVSPGHSKSFTVVYSPTTSGSASATLTFTSNAKNSPTILNLSGTGVSGGGHSVSLSWNASTSQVAGYNVYRGDKMGGPYSVINTGLDASTTYTDSGVVAGATYYYVTTAVDSGGDESAYSNEVKAVVPSP